MDGQLSLEDSFLDRRWIAGACDPNPIPVQSRFHSRDVTKLWAPSSWTAYVSRVPAIRYHSKVQSPKSTPGIPGTSRFEVREVCFPGFPERTSTLERETDLRLRKDEMNHAPHCCVSFREIRRSSRHIGFRRPDFLRPVCAHPELESTSTCALQDLGLGVAKAPVNLKYLVLLAAGPGPSPH
jgi:hypothetical protein